MNTFCVRSTNELTDMLEPMLRTIKGGTSWSPGIYLGPHIGDMWSHETDPAWYKGTVMREGM